MPPVPSTSRQTLILLPSSPSTHPKHILAVLGSHPSPTPLTFAVPTTYDPADRPATFEDTGRIIGQLYGYLPIDREDCTFVLTHPRARDGVLVHSQDGLLKRAWGNVIDLAAGSDKEAGRGGETAEPEKKEEEEEHLRVAAVGGTFDHLHHGHRLLLSLSAYMVSPRAREPRRLVIGISGDELLLKKAFREYLQPWRERVASVLHFLRCLSLEQGAPEKEGQKEDGRKTVTLELSGVWVECVELREPCGPTIEDPEIEVLVVTEETRGGGEYVNGVRRERGMGELRVEVVGLVGSGVGTEVKLSSTDARRRAAAAAGVELPAQKQ